ncbi:carboxylesterase/lipase family protein [Sphingomonas psychrotolerans]|uniref:Carboxylesterase n=1 Tax=Sphingomonas psychrotolerans TaxID=1327635 RepID=A0A2K8MAZ4_9SPHN|nr:carboxylesterase family protein [Sphingomonas psychrotolerans]ATY31050.1 carboxylesterase [Sphingomonas psychrotolerans]
MRRAFAALIALSAALPAAAQTAARPVAVDGGKIDGVTLPGGVDAWLGVPFAAPPLRELRWRAPAPVPGWQGVRHADRFAPECLQPLRSARQNHYFGEEATSEDCLYLNVWAPRRARKAPVVVWIYGGGFNIGSASMANYSGEPLARAGVVRVNIAYRVGPLGFLAHPELSAELSAESGNRGSGNYGLMDQIAALKWVKRNIAKVGGDPDNVTIVGQSAGSMSVALLQMSPMARGLFHRAVGMSGSPFGGMMAPAPLARAEAQGMALQKELGAASLADLRAIAGDRLVAAATRRDPIVLDGRIVTGRAEEVFAQRRQNDVPILIGYTHDESFGPLGPASDRAALAQAVRTRFGERADAILRAYADAPPARAATDIGRDASVGLQMAEWAGHQRTYGTQPAYAYLFTRRQPYAPGVTFSDHDPATVGAYHTGDVPYWLRTRDSLNLFRTTRNWEPGDRSLEGVMSGALLAFAHTGVPRGPGGVWPAFDPAAPRLMWLAPESRVAPWPHHADMGLFAGGERRSSGGRPRD